MNNNAIIIASYLQHKNYIDKFLYSIKNNTDNDIDIYIVVSKDEYNDFIYLTTKYEHINLLIFSKIVELIEKQCIDEEKLLERYGKYKYQSLKKYYGIYYLFYNDLCEHVIIFDSESIVVRKTNINDIINEYITQPFIIYSSEILQDKLHKCVDMTTKKLLDIECHNYIGWFMEYYCWIYEQNIFKDFVYMLLIRYNKPLIDIIEEYEDVFIENIYLTYIYLNNELYHYRLVDLNEYMKREMSLTTEEIESIYKSISPQRPLEDARLLVKQENENITKIYDNLKLCLYKTSDDERSLNFIARMKNIRMCVSEYADRIFNYYYPLYNINCKENYCFISNNIQQKEGIYTVIKSSNNKTTFNWLGYELSAEENTKICLTFEMFVKSFNFVRTPNTYIAFKRHNPCKIDKINIIGRQLQQWMTYRYEVDVNSSKRELFIIIFDDAPACHILIRNFSFFTI